MKDNQANQSELDVSNLSKEAAIHARVIHSLKDEFQAAADEALDIYLQAAGKAITDTALPGTRNCTSLKYNIASARVKMQFLLAGAEGRYHNGNDYSAPISAGKAWGEYLDELGHGQHGWASYPANESILRGLIKINGPKKMEHRLTQYVRRQISQAVNSISEYVLPAEALREFKRSLKVRTPS